MRGSLSSARPNSYLELGSGFAVRVTERGPSGIYRNHELFGRDESDSFERYCDVLRGQDDACGFYKAKLLVTGKCNQRCYYCYAAADWRKPGLSTAELVAVLDRLKQARIVHVQFHGGDVAVRRDLPALIEHCDRIGLTVDFFTNASGPVFEDDELYRVIENCRCPPVVTVSLLSGVPADHDRLAGSAGAFRRALESIVRLQEVRCPVRLSLSLTTESQNGLRAARVLADQLDCELSIIAEVYSSIGGTSDTNHFELAPHELISARSALLGDERVELHQRSCTAGVTTITLDHEAFLVGCDRNTTQRFGSVLEQPLRELVRAPAYVDYMQRTYRRPAPCAACPDELRRFCNWCPAIPLNDGVEQQAWVDVHCRQAMRRRLFWTGASNPIAGSRQAAQDALSG